MKLRPDSLRFTPSDGRVTLAIFLYILLLMALPLVLAEPTFHWTFSEEGPFEQLSIVAWLFTGALILLRIRPLGARAGAFALLCVVFAAREADLHKAFTAASILKTNYYRHIPAPFAEKLIAGCVALAAIGVVIYVGLVVARFLFLEGGWRSRSGIWLMLGTVLVLLGKVLDRAPAVLFNNYGITLSPVMNLYADAFEEGLEMIHPLILAWSVWVSQTERRYLSVEPVLRKLAIPVPLTVHTPAPVSAKKPAPVKAASAKILEEEVL
ncbi:hypothetical protein [Noviherbaspirillum massiliense]|uniref:hypothetical protein n=1 Tax=Noviherbaspirillum massiliense TaxID=1465823 RepID=UPI0002F10ED7|nr:hypothetical protein [Noviherbaspirillum massiliense]